jgi:predicted transposase YbfD/YdcC
MAPASCWRKRGVRRQHGEGELTAALRLLPQLPLAGRLLTGDALYCQRAVCEQVVAAGGDYLVTVKENQPTLFAAIELLFSQPPPAEVFVTTSQRARHGDRLELRTVTASSALAGYLDWPGAQQVFRLVRRVRRKGQVTEQVRFGITSLSSAQADAAALLRFRRGHWAIENRLHWVRDVTFGEDACQVRSGAAPQVLAALRNAVIGLLRRWRTPNIAAGLRTLAWRPGAVLEILGLTLV